MKINPNNPLPDYLKDLLIPTPSGIAKLIAAWHGLSTETQILFMTEIEETIGSYGFNSESLNKSLNEFLKVAIRNNNPYVRYLAATKFYFCSHDAEIIKLIDNDPEPLVRYSNARFDFEHKEEFFKLPQEVRLGVIKNWHIDDGEKIANLISYAIENELQGDIDKTIVYGAKGENVSENEIEEILTTYLLSDKFNKYYRVDLNSYATGDAAYSVGKDINALWNLVAKVPESISHPLIQYLPPGAGLSGGIPENILQNLTERQLVTLLHRQDIKLTDFRKKIFFERANDSKTKSYDSLTCAACCYHFNLSYLEFLQLSKKPKKEMIPIMNDLTLANDLSLWLYDAIHNILNESEERILYFETGSSARARLKEKLNDPKVIRDKYQLIELKLYRLAKRRSLPSAASSYGILKFLDTSVVEGDILETFGKFLKAWKKEMGEYSFPQMEIPKEWNDLSIEAFKKEIEMSLPRLNEIDDGLEQGSDPTELAECVEDNLSKIISSISPDAELKNKNAVRGIGKIAAHLINSQNKIKEEINSLKNQLNTLQSSQKTFLTTILVLVIIILIILL